MKLLTAILATLLFTACASTPSTKPATETKAAPAAEAVKKADSRAPAQATKSASTTSDNVTCKLGDVERSISIVKNTENCVVEYTKDGNKSEIANGNLNSTYCKEVQDRVKNNLTAAGYSCN